MNKLISAIVVSKNEEKYIESCLRSIKNQTYKPLEIIVSDACSKDKTVKIAKKYADKIIVEKTNVSQGRNLGAKHAKGEILFFVDADTILLPETIEKVAKIFKNKKVVGATCSILPLSSEAIHMIFYSIYNHFIKLSLKTKKPKVTGLSCAFQKDAFQEVGGFDETLETLEDFDLAERISQLGKIVFVDSTFVLTSSRRIKYWGKINSIKKYMKMYLRYLIKKKGFNSNEYKPIR